jgi:GTP pyrophosphokinase
MMAGSAPRLAEPLLAQLTGRFSQEELERVRHAYAVAARWHAGQWRKSGDPYIAHPVAVAEAAAEVGMDCTMVCAALLHDVLEDTACDREQLRNEFGEDITGLVERVTALRHDADAPDDDRVITLKLLDRLHNMRTIQYVPTDKQLAKSRETLDLLVPHAQRLGLALVAEELRDLARHRLDVLAGIADGEMKTTLCALRLGSLTMPAPARARYLEEWLAELREPADPRRRRRFARQLIAGLPRLSFMLHKQQWSDRYATTVHRAAASRPSRYGRKALGWVLRSQVRPWLLLAPLTVWIVMRSAQGNAGSAVATLITLPPVLAAAVKWLRDWLG